MCRASHRSNLVNGKEAEKNCVVRSFCWSVVEKFHYFGQLLLEVLSWETGGVGSRHRWEKGSERYIRRVPGPGLCFARSLPAPVQRLSSRFFFFLSSLAFFFLSLSKGFSFVVHHRVDLEMMQYVVHVRGSMWYMDFQLWAEKRKEIEEEEANEKALENARASCCSRRAWPAM